MALSPLGEFKVKLVVSSLVGLFAASAVPSGVRIIEGMKSYRNEAISQFFNPEIYRQRDLARAESLKASVALQNVDQIFHKKCEQKVRQDFPEVFAREGADTKSLELGRFTEQCALAEASKEAKELEERGSLRSHTYTGHAAVQATAFSFALNGIPLLATFGLMSVFFSAGRIRGERKAAQAASPDASHRGSDRDCSYDEGGSEFCGPAQSPAGPSHHR